MGGPRRKPSEKKGLGGAKHDLPDHYLEGGWDQIVFIPVHLLARHIR